MQANREPAQVCAADMSKIWGEILSYLVIQDAAYMQGCLMLPILKPLDQMPIPVVPTLELCLFMPSGSSRPPPCFCPIILTVWDLHRVGEAA